MTVSLVVLLVLGFGYLAVAVVFAARQDMLFFKPRRVLAASPADAGLAFEDLALTTDDGVSLHAWWVPGPPTPSPQQPGRMFTLLYLHGANTNLGDRVDTLRCWHELGFDILALDYRGYGRSGGRPSEAGLARDAEAAWHWLTGRRGLSPGRILIAAESMGVSLALMLAVRRGPVGLVLEGGFTRAADVAARRYWWLPVRQLIRLQLAAEDLIGAVRCPKLLVHSVDDLTVPITLGRRLEQLAAPPCRFLKVRGAHARACIEGGPRYRDGLQRWLEELEMNDGVA
jgi:uncharacterized protein